MRSVKARDRGCIGRRTYRRSLHHVATAGADLHDAVFSCADAAVSTKSADVPRAHDVTASNTSAGCRATGKYSARSSARRPCRWARRAASALIHEGRASISVASTHDSRFTSSMARSRPESEELDERHDHGQLDRSFERNSASSRLLSVDALQCSNLEEAFSSSVL